MIETEKKDFKELMDATSEYYQREKLSLMALQIYFQALARFEVTQIQHAISKHIQCSKSGQFYPKVADIVRHIEGGDLTTDQILAAARLKKTPHGILCRIQIGSWDLKHQTDMFYLKQRAEECLHLMEGWKSRALSGEYSDHEISCMLMHGVDPVQPFFEGLPPPLNAEFLSERIEQVEKTERHLRLIAPTADQSYEKDDRPAANVAEFISNLMKG